MERENRKGHGNSLIIKKIIAYKKLISPKLSVAALAAGSKDWKMRVLFKNFGRNLTWH